MTPKKTPPPAHIRVEHVSYDYPGLRALDDISFVLAPASITALVGPNGAGKTTLLRAMAALEAPMEGRICIDDLDIWAHPREAHRRLGYLPDHFGLYGELSAERCLTYAALAHGLPEAHVDKAVSWAAEQVDLADKLTARADTLSRGQRQRLALAQVIVHRPAVLLLDEPASGLDPQARADLSRLMKSLAAQGMTLLISSHILAELESYCTAMLVLEKGRLLAHQQTEAAARVNAESATPLREFRVRLSRMSDAFSPWCAEREIGVTAESDNLWRLSVPLADDAAQARLLRELSSRWELLEFTPQVRNLQTLYLETVKSGKEKQA